MLGIALRIPLFTGRDFLREILQLLCSFSEPMSWLFPVPNNPSLRMSVSMLNSIVKREVRRAGVEPPLGMKFTGRSLRSGYLTAAYTTGVKKEVILRLANRSGEKILFFHYVDTLAKPSAAARAFFARFFPLSTASG